MRQASTLMIPVVVAAMAVQPTPAQQSVFRGTVNGVTVDVAVRKGNTPVPNLGAADFVVYDNGVRQKIESVSLSAIPIDVTVFLGTNNQASAKQLSNLSSDVKKIGTLLGADDQVQLLTLANRVVDVFGWRPGDRAQASINVQVGGVQSLYDALFLAMMHPPDPTRRHLVVAISDGVEFGSVVDSTTLRDVARRAEAVLHLVFLDAGGERAPEAPLPGPGNPTLARGTFPPSGAPANSATTSTGAFLFLRASWFHVRADVQGIDRLSETAQLTGGTVRHTSAGEPIVESFKQAFEDFRQSYVLRYAATGVEAGGWHDVRVEVLNQPKYVIRARRGYFGR
jgi:VWFA-related protein